MKTIAVYEFKELSEKAKQKAISNFKKTFDVDLDCFNDDVENALEEKDIELYKLCYSFSYSQGDGLSFCSEFDKAKYLDLCFPTLSEKRKFILSNIIAKIKSTQNKGHYSYASKNDIEIELYSYLCEKRYSNIYTYINQLEIFIQDLYISLCNEFEKCGYNEIESQLSDEYIAETIQANEYEFLENGTML